MPRTQLLSFLPSWSRITKPASGEPPHFASLIFPPGSSLWATSDNGNPPTNFALSLHAPVSVSNVKNYRTFAIRILYRKISLQSAPDWRPFPASSSALSPSAGCASRGSCHRDLFRRGVDREVSVGRFRDITALCGLLTELKRRLRFPAAVILNCKVA